MLTRVMAMNSLVRPKRRSPSETCQNELAHGEMNEHV